MAISTTETDDIAFSVGRQTLRCGRFFAALVYFLVRPLSNLVEPPKEKELHTDLYVMF